MPYYILQCEANTVAHNFPLQSKISKHNAVFSPLANPSHRFQKTPSLQIVVTIDLTCIFCLGVDNHAI